MMLIYSLKNLFFGTRNLGDIQLADAKSSSGLIYLIYYQRKKTSNKYKYFKFIKMNNDMKQFRLLLTICDFIAALKSELYSN